MSRLSELAHRFARVTSSGNYVPQIDGLRFLAITPVLFFHAALRGERISINLPPDDQLATSWIPAGQVGVSLFFFVSGYIISFPFLAGRAPRLQDFYARRLMRLHPPYVIVLLCCFLIVSVYTPRNAPNFEFTSAPAWHSLIASLFYVHGLVFGENPKLNPPAWSLEFEMQFYLVAPLLLYLYLKIKNRTLRRCLGAALCVALIILGQWIAENFVRQHPLRHSVLIDAYAFVLGILVCDYAVTAQPSSLNSDRRYDLLLVLGYVGLLITGSLEYNLFSPVLSVLNTVARAICILCVFAGAFRGALGRRVLGSPWIAFIGGACYSIYLVHVPVMHAGSALIVHVMTPTSLWVAWVISWVVLIPLSVAVGLTFYLLVERPLMRPDWARELLAAMTARERRDKAATPVAR